MLRSLPGLARTCQRLTDPAVRLSRALLHTLPKLVVRTLVSSLLEENCYLLESGDQCVVIDPGDRAQEIIRLLGVSGKSLSAVLCTHGHFDHIGSLGVLQRYFSSTPCYLHPSDGFLATSLPELSRQYGVSGVPPLLPTLSLGKGLTLTLLGVPVKVLHTPGHSPGSCCFLVDADLLFTGDTLFAGSVGRTDLPGGDACELFKSIESEILVLSPGVQVLPGHGPPSTVQIERDTNPFLQQSMKIDF